MSVHGPILRKLLRRALTPCIIDDRRTYRGIELLVASAHIRDVVAAKSKTPTVALLIPTSGGFPAAALGVWSAGKSVVPVNYLLSPAEMQYIIDDCGADTVLASKALLDHLQWKPERVNIVELESLNFKSMPDIAWPASASDDDLAVLLYTSGTSGKPKGVMLTHGNINANINQCLQAVPLNSTDKVLGVLPQFHSFGLTVLTLLPLRKGFPAVYTARFVPAKLLQLIREHRPTLFVAIPSMYGALAQLKNATPEDFASLRYVVSGGEALPDAIRRAFHERFNVMINEGYGLTETSPVTNWCRPFEFRPHSVGPPLPRIHERIVDPATEQDVPTGAEGEVRIKGPNIMAGYHNMPEATAQMFDAAGYLKTGDMGRFDNDGHLFITGRIKEMLIIAGENVFPREIEEVLDDHPMVAKSGVVGKRDDVRGEVPVAFVELAEGIEASSFDEKEAQRFCRERMAGFKVPREIHVLDALPRNPTGKVLRRELSKLAAQEPQHQ